MEIIVDNGSAGVTTAEIVQKAAEMGRTLQATSVSSMLSRFKREGILRFDGQRYYPITKASDDPPPSQPFRVVA